MQKSSAGRADEMQAKLSGKEELCRSLEQQIIDMKQNSIKYDSEISQLKKSLDAKDDTVARLNNFMDETPISTNLFHIFSKKCLNVQLVNF